jgi:hypothetical protein
MFKNLDTLFWIFILVVLAIGIIFPIILYFALPFDDVITIKDKYTESRGRSGGIKYHIIDTNNKIYLVDNTWFTGDFSRAEDYNFMDKGGKFRVQGYGKRVDFLGWYPIITKVSKA